MNEWIDLFISYEASHYIYQQLRQVTIHDTIERSSCHLQQEHESLLNATEKKDLIRVLQSDTVVWLHESKYRLLF